MNNKQKQIVFTARQVISGELYLEDDRLKALLDDLNRISSTSSPWWVVVLKVLAYAIGLILAGVGTANASTLFINF